MKAIKVISAIILCIILLVAECFVMGMFSVDKALSENTIKESMKETNVVENIVDEALSQNTVNMGGRYGEMINAVMKSDAMITFLSDYVSRTIDTQIFDEKYAAISGNELMTAFAKGVEEVNKSGTMSISETEEEFLKQTIAEEAAGLTANLNSYIESYNSKNEAAAGEPDEQTELLTSMMNIGTRVLSLAVCLAICAVLVIMFRKSQLGYLWCAVVTAMSSILYGLMSLIGKDGIMGTVTSSASEEMALSMVAKGFAAVSCAGFVATAIFIILFVVMKITGRRRNHEDFTASAKRTFEGN